MNWQQINYMSPGPLQAVLNSHDAAFQGGLGALQGYQAKILVDPNAKPRFSKARSLLYAYREVVEKELDRLVVMGTLELVEFPEWVSPIVSLEKSDRRSIRISGDFKQIINPVSKLDWYPAHSQGGRFVHFNG